MCIRDSTKMKANLSQAPTVHIRKFFEEARKNIKASGANKGKKTSRLYSKAVVMGFKRALRSQSTNTSLIKIQGVEDTASTDFYLGKKVLYMYRAKTEKNGKFMRCVWGKVTRSHGTSGVVRAKFSKNLPPSAHGAACRVMLYPSRV
eukprot:TRINITY_DN1514_c0_g1_i12.p2 TRINITY_DN1514_c0_g1~~TRINITY_DN1514_c0_g1_i12.p2  ORF type:complete len:147 (-),score=41.05 TRINITY_DN1514_c0_g1_i12:100-540(-)